MGGIGQESGELANVGGAMPSEQVTELKDSQGRVQGFRCPQCRQVYASVEEADRCLTTHAHQLTE